MKDVSPTIVKVEELKGFFFTSLWQVDECQVKSEAIRASRRVFFLTPYLIPLV